MTTIRQFTWYVALGGLLGCSLAQQVPAQQPPRAAAQTPGAVAAKFTCEEPVFDFGERDNSTVVEHVFVIRNDGQTTLEIGSAKPSCGCTVANISQRSVEPGATATITAKLNLRGRTGKQHKTITVQSNDPKNAQTVLTLAGTATTLVEVTPRSLHASNLKIGQTVTNIITVTSREDTPLEITGIETGNPLVTAELVEVTAGKEYQIVVRTSADLPKGPTFGRIAIRTTSKRLPLTNVAFRYNVIGEISVYPQELAMLQQDTPMAKTLVVTPGTVSDFKITDIKVPSEDIKVSISKLGGGRYRVVLSNIIPTMELNGQNVHVLTTAANMEDVAIPFKVIRRR